MYLECSNCKSIKFKKLFNFLFSFSQITKDKTSKIFAIDRALSSSNVKKPRLLNYGYLGRNCAPYDKLALTPLDRDFQMRERT